MHACYIIPQVLLPIYTRPLKFGGDLRGKWTTHELHQLRTHFRYYLDKKNYPVLKRVKPFLPSMKLNTNAIHAQHSLELDHVRGNCWRKRRLLDATSPEVDSTPLPERKRSKK